MKKKNIGGEECRDVRSMLALLYHAGAMFVSNTLLSPPATPRLGPIAWERKQERLCKQCASKGDAFCSEIYASEGRQ